MNLSTALIAVAVMLGLLDDVEVIGEAANGEQAESATSPAVPG
ncbi:hypothetical protein ABT297_41500 [Dactylosporangium sp. NPDC000555]